GGGMQPSGPDVGWGVVDGAVLGTAVGTIATGPGEPVGGGGGGGVGPLAIENAGGVQPDASRPPTKRSTTTPTTARNTRLRRRRFGSMITWRSCARARAASASSKSGSRRTFEWLPRG